MKTKISIYSYYESYVPNCVRTISQIKDFGAVISAVTICSTQKSVLEAWRTELSAANICLSPKFILHDNNDWEFGAYQRLALSGKSDPNIEDDQHVKIIFNDTIGTHSLFEREDIRRFVEQLNDVKAESAPTIVGELDSDKKNPHRHWIRSCLFGLNRSENNLKINWNPVTRGTVELTRDDSRAAGYKFTCSLLSPDECASIIDWLVPRKASASSWIGGKTLEKEEEKILRKAICITKERLLSDEFSKHGVRFINTLPSSIFSRLKYRMRRKIFMRKRLKKG
jgi:hypothetical protein